MISLYRFTLFNLLCLTFFSVPLLTSSYAAPVTAIYEGTVVSATGGSPFQSLRGSTLRFEYTYEEFAIDMDLDPSIGFYSADAVTSASASILGSNGTLFSASLSTNTFNNGILVRDDAPADYYSMGLRLFSTSSIGGGFVAFSSLTFSNENAPNNIATTPFTSDALTSTPVDPADFVTTFIKLNFGSSGVGSPCVPACALFANAIRTVSSPVPAPSAIPLMGTGLVGLIVFRRWQGKFRHI